ncbi:translation initiation factor IF-1 [Candidatus Nomurabacteria bacterium]|uniref:Translation initiation factor IF-1 n=1 Tax=Candidatus Kaiserbacteria bacterium CG10_big_fil_rev_8_21_14_0_10_44_10 TaxID=1974606 RepID=A0A2H0UJC3_9BACT|nr:translation initiation factor IF-1 [Candidatus Nomurabacteria bacterium]PIR85796.1 MAG: translation initiation factor IF-1 [Candidatus Kaiserbacteria bacterium CG10_big_fil_rev_8_21_14_0_10_44_10]
MPAPQEKENLIYGTVEEALPNALFRVVLDDTNEKVLTYLSGKMRKFRIRVLVGDKVAIVPEPYGGKGRITKRI